MTDQADGLRRLMAGNTARRITLVDSASDSGACSVALNLAAALEQQGRDVLLLDERNGPQVAPPARGGRLVLVDAVLHSDGTLSPLAASADHILVVCAARSEAITQTYLCIKKLHYAHALANLRVLVNEAADPAQARRLLANLASTGSRYLGMALEPAGFVRADPFLAQARRLNLSVVQGFSASNAARDFLQIASDLVNWPCLAAPDRTPFELSRQRAVHDVQPSAGLH
ncbi:Flagellar synthesis regulator FleN [Polaromonas sp. CG9_12]|nr:Flagellar synthesis regulator FleN [Polaromonas sp. CG9_12]